jgi:hypothetical protein
MYDLAATNPIHTKEPGDNIAVMMAMSGVGLGFLCLLEGLFNMSFNLNKLGSA